MKKITLSEAFQLLRQANAIKIGKPGKERVAIPTLFDLENKDDNQFLMLTVYLDGYEFYSEFLEKDNQSVFLDGNNMTLVNSEQFETTFQLLVPMLLV